MNSKLLKFFNENETRIGEEKDFKTYPPVYYYTSLNNAYYHYFKTFQSHNYKYEGICDFQENDRYRLAFNFTDDYNTTFALLSFHRFFELYLKDALRMIHPVLSVRTFEKSKDLIAFLGGEVDFSTINTIEYSETVRRVKDLLVREEGFSLNEGLSKNLDKIKPKIEFLSEDRNIETLDILNYWRNRIMHNGSTLINIRALDYLITQRVIPLLCNNIIMFDEKEEQQKYTPYFFETPTGINIINELLSIKFSFEDFDNKKKHKEMEYSLMKIGHLKEMGRACFNLPIPMRKNIATPHEYNYDDPLGRGLRLAQGEEHCEKYKSTQCCPVCGIASLVLYEDPLSVEVQEFFGRQNIRFVKCYTCDYMLRENAGEPNFFGLNNELLFT